MVCLTVMVFSEKKKTAKILLLETTTTLQNTQVPDKYLHNFSTSVWQ